MESISPILEFSSNPEKIKPEFLKKMSVDYPEVSDDINLRVESWKLNVDKTIGIDGFGQAILNKMEYIDNSEREIFLNSVADELISVWNKDPQRAIRFIAWDAGKSGKWFYDDILTKIPEEKHNLVKFMGSYDVGYENNSEQDPVDILYFHLDDSANSGQQIQQSVYAMRDLIRNSSKEQKNKMIKKPTELRIRLMRLTDSVKQNIQNETKFMKENENELVHIDIDSNPIANKKMPTMDDVAKDFEIEKTELFNHPFFYSHHGRRPATLAIFSHKIQDNMPIMLLEGQRKTSFESLITTKNIEAIKPPYKTNPMN